MNKSLLIILANPRKFRQIVEKPKRIYNIKINKLNKDKLNIKIHKLLKQNIKIHKPLKPLKPQKLPLKIDLRYKFFTFFIR